VDKDKTAVRIARLRLWLALASELEGDLPPPLSRQDFHIECGDSLTADPPYVSKQRWLEGGWLGRPTPRP